MSGGKGEERCEMGEKGTGCDDQKEGNTPITQRISSAGSREGVGPGGGGSVLAIGCGGRSFSDKRRKLRRCHETDRSEKQQEEKWIRPERASELLGKNERRGGKEDQSREKGTLSRTRTSLLIELHSPRGGGREICWTSKSTDHLSDEKKASH